MVEIKLNTEINKSAEECWQVFGGGYTDIYTWKSDIQSSDAEGEPFGDCPVGSRKIKTSGLSFSEKLIHFSNAERAFTYEVVGLPFVVSSAKNEWKFSETNGKATLHMHLRLQTLTGFGWLLNGLLQKNMTKEMGKLHQEFKHFMENGEVHPRKEKELKK
ncbi:MAG: SRPBCC family protein [Flavobacteriales bacterium]|nr:SRPBCC family protein [Flavobacteriales bacterium]